MDDIKEAIESLNEIKTSIEQVINKLQKLNLEKLKTIEKHDDNADQQEIPPPLSPKDDPYANEFNITLSKLAINMLIIAFKANPEKPPQAHLGSMNILMKEEFVREINENNVITFYVKYTMKKIGSVWGCGPNKKSTKTDAAKKVIDYIIENYSDK